MKAFTLIELLVVVVIIGLLVAIVIPAANMARETARRAQCVSQQRDLAKAMIEYSNSNNGLPGYLNKLGNTPEHSWAVALMPGIGENKRYEAILSNQLNDAIAPVSAFLCPSDRASRQEDARLNYVVNCGPADELLFQDGIPILPLLDLILFKDRRVPYTKRYKIEDIPNGASNTILLSESVVFHNHHNVGLWYPPPSESESDSEPQPASTRFAEWSPPLLDEFPYRNMDDVSYLGFVWGPSGDYLPVSSVLAGAEARVPRPSSRHPGVFVSAFADGSARAMNDEIGINEWLRFVNPE